MITIYELLEVEEDASKEEIEMAYSRLILEFRQDINFDAETNKENEMITNKLKLAYEILIDDEKRKKYDYQLAQQRAENLIENISIRQDEPKQNDINVSMENNSDKTSSNRHENQKPQVEKQRVTRNINQQEDLAEDDVLTQKEKKEIRKAAQKEFQQKLKKAKQAEEEYKEAYNKAYNDYLRKNGYKVKEPWTLKRIKRLIIAILVVVLVCFIMWLIPPIKNMLIELYEENFIIKTLVDIVKSIVDIIIN